MQTNTVLEYKCPCCDAGLKFGQDVQQMKCEYCDNVFDLDTVREYAEGTKAPEPEKFQWEQAESQQWSQEEQGHIRSFLCQTCGGELLTDENTAATFCPYCGNPTILPGRVSDGLKPDGVLPFRTGKEDAKAAFLKLCHGKPLLPKFFTKEQQLEKITGIYVPFWLYDCSADFQGSYKATRIHTWSDPKFTYTKTDHYLLNRRAQAAFAGIPMDGSSKMEDAFMESIEPFDYSALVDFDTAYLSGFLADKYDVPSEDGQPRIRQRVENSMNQQIQQSILGYATAIPANCKIDVRHSKAKYVLLPVWILNTKYRGKTYTFAMNGQTGKMTGTLPICPKRSAGWFFGLWAGITAVVTAFLMLF